jgi:HPr kinase/phosphorylase
MNAQRQFSVVQLYEDHREKLKLTWVVAVGVDRQIELRDQGYFGAEVVGHLNLIHPERLQVIGRAENDWGNRRQ